MTPPIGYYVHHQGDGHLQRALAIAEHAPERFLLMGTGLAGRTGQIANLNLPDDRMSVDMAFDGFDETINRPDALHYAPLGHLGVRRRVAMATAWIARAQPALMVVDVSVEIAMLARLASTPTVYVRLAGDRSDPAHLEAFRGAVALLSPFAAALDDPSLPEWVLAKTHYAPGLDRFSPPNRSTPCADVLVVVGRGGSSVCGVALAHAAMSTPTRRWTVLGAVDPPGACPANLEFLGWTEDAGARIANAQVVVGAGGDGVVSAVLAGDRPFVCLPEVRPYDEQVTKARRLGALGAAIHLETWPLASAWPAVLAAAEALPAGPRRALHVQDGAARAAAVLLAAADFPAVE